MIALTGARHPWPGRSWRWRPCDIREPSCVVGDTSVHPSHAFFIRSESTGWASVVFERSREEFVFSISGSVCRCPLA